MSRRRALIDVAPAAPEGGFAPRGTRYVPLEVSHAGLWLDKYMGLPEYVPGAKPQEPPLTPEQSLVNQTTRIPEPPAYTAFYTRWAAAMRARTSYIAYAVAVDRLAVGLGAEGVLETTLTLHHTYGVPYLPGSALKGLAAAYTRQRLGHKDPLWAADGAAYRTLFGDTTTASYITFFDALYVPNTQREPRDTEVRARPLHPDVLTVHHPKYYQNTNPDPPADWDDPNPVPFITATGTYLVALAGPPGTDVADWLTAALHILQYALADMGIGAKTAAGYGRMILDLQHIQSPAAASAVVPAATAPTPADSIPALTTPVEPGEVLAPPPLQVGNDYLLKVLRLPGETGDGSVELVIKDYNSAEAIGRIDGSVLDRQYPAHGTARVVVQGIRHEEGRYIVDLVPAPRRERN